MRKIKTILGIVFSLAIVTTMNTTVFAANDSGIPERRGVYIRECVGYEPNYTNIDYTHKLLGSVSGDNTQGSSPMQITYQYEQSGTTTASIAGYANGTTEANVVFAKMQAEVGVEVTGSRSWTKGTSAGVSYSIAPGKFEVLNVYIPAVRTAGRLKYKVYMDGYPENVFYEYKTLTESYAPQKNSDTPDYNIWRFEALNRAVTTLNNEQKEHVAQTFLCSLEMEWHFWEAAWQQKTWQFQH